MGREVQCWAVGSCLAELVHTRPGLEALLAERIARAAAAWPTVVLDAASFVRAIVERLPREAPEPALQAMHTDDLYLASGCVAGDAAAFAGFEAHCGPTIARAVTTTGVSTADRADLGQVVRQRLLVARAQGGVPRIASYSARSALPTWVRVVASRELLRLLPRRHRDLGAGDYELARRIAADDDPEIGYLKRLYRHEFKQAFHAAVDALDPRERLLLRQHLLDGLGVDELARLHGVHRATAARWISAVRDTVLARTQRELIRRLQLSRSELASILRLIRSQLDVSLPRILQHSA